MERDLSLIKSDPVNNWLNHLTQVQEDKLGPIAGPAAALAYANRRLPIGRIITIYRTDKQLPDVVSDSDVFSI
jgi:hypothetical protein